MNKYCNNIAIDYGGTLRREIVDVIEITGGPHKPIVRLEVVSMYKLGMDNELICDMVGAYNEKLTKLKNDEKIRNQFPGKSNP